VGGARKSGFCSWMALFCGPSMVAPTLPRIGSGIILESSFQSWGFASTLASNEVVDGMKAGAGMEWTTPTRNRNIEEMRIGLGMTLWGEWLRRRSGSKSVIGVFKRPTQPPRMVTYVLRNFLRRKAPQIPISTKMVSRRTRLARNSRLVHLGLK
jgi:hypothetical protein